MLRYLRAEAGATARPALFLDRDGVLNRHVVDGYVLTHGDFEPIDLATDAAVVAQELGAALIVVTNQGAIGRGLVSEADVMTIHSHLIAALGAKGIVLDAIYVCPHHPKSPDPGQRECLCRKPKPGMLLAAARDLNLDLQQSILIGDQPSDVQAARAAGIADDHAILVGPDHGNPADVVRSVWGA